MAIRYDRFSSVTRKHVLVLMKISILKIWKNYFFNKDTVVFLLFLEISILQPYNTVTRCERVTPNTNSDINNKYLYSALLRSNSHNAVNMYYMRDDISNKFKTSKHTIVCYPSQTVKP